MLRASISLIAFLFANSLFAADIFVDNNSSCPGTGASGSPYCTIQNAFNKPPSAGDHIKMRTGTGTYDATATLAATNGAEGNPIVIEPDTGADFIITNLLQIRYSSYITIQNLTWDGTSGNQSHTGLRIQAYDDGGDNHGQGDQVGIQVLNNTFKNWDAIEDVAANTGRHVLLISTGNCDPSVCTYKNLGTIVRGNLFDGNRQISLLMQGTVNTLIENNEFKNHRAATDVDWAVNNAGIKILGGSDTNYWATGLMVRNNIFHDWVPFNNNDVGHWYCLDSDPGNCGLFSSDPGELYHSRAYDTYVGVWCDVAAVSSTIDGNTIYNIDQGNTNPDIHSSAGIIVEAGCDDWTVKNNVVYNIGYFGISHRLRGDVDPATWDMEPTKRYQNTVYGSFVRAFGMGAGNFVMKNNIAYGTGAASLMSPSYVAPAGHYDIDYNRYYDSVNGNTLVGQWSATTNSPTSLANWQTACSCDSHSTYGDPGLVTPGSDFSLQSGSAAKNAGTNVGVTTDRLGNPRPSGSGYDMGAYEYQEDGVRNRAVVISWR